MKYIFVSFLFFLISCTSPDQTIRYRKDFSSSEKEIIKEAKQTIQNCYFGTLISIDENGQPRARVMEPFAPDSDFTIWMATNPKSRKVKQIKANSNVTLHYFDKAHMSYVSLMGKAYIVNDPKIKATKWKKGWENFYPNQTDAYLLIKFVPEFLEYINIPSGYTGDSATWRPHQVVLRNYLES